MMAVIKTDALDAGDTVTEYTISDGTATDTQLQFK